MKTMYSLVPLFLQTFKFWFTSCTNKKYLTKIRTGVSLVISHLRRNPPLMAKLCQFVNRRCLKVITMSVSVHSYFTSVIATTPAALLPPVVRISAHTYPACEGVLEIVRFQWHLPSDVFHKHFLKIPLFVGKRAEGNNTKLLTVLGQLEPKTGSQVSHTPP